MELRAGGGEIHYTPHTGWTRASAAEFILSQDVPHPRGASTGSGYSCSVTPLWCRRAVSPEKLPSWALQTPSQTLLGTGSLHALP